MQIRTLNYSFSEGIMVLSHRACNSRQVKKNARPKPHDQPTIAFSLRA